MLFQIKSKLHLLDTQGLKHEIEEVTSSIQVYKAR